MTSIAGNAAIVAASELTGDRTGYRMAPGSRYVLLDPVRDAGFLSLSSVNNPVAPVNDAGLGVVDNGIFVYTSAYVPGTKTKRQYPIKFFWIGSPAGTTDVNDQFSIYMADVNPSGFYPGAPPSGWLVNPRLVLHQSQAITDVIKWFDTNYPGGAVGGVGNSNTGNNTQYGTLGGGTTPVGDISGKNSIDGQFWPIYDYVDGSMILYFSYKTPNLNTLSIYAYKTTANEGMENVSPLGSAQFLGGLSGVGWLGSSFSNGVTFGSGTTTGLLSSHRFSVVSPDPLVSYPRVSGQQSAVFAHSYGVFYSSSTPDHGANIGMAVVQDVHGTPLSPTPVAYQSNSEFSNLDVLGVYPVDKLGTISVCAPVDGVTSGYAMIYNAPSDRDLRGGTGPVVISAMQIRILFWNPGLVGTWGYGRTPILFSYGPETIGTCRPQFTTLPDGVPKLLYANFSSDQNLSLGYQYAAPDLISPAWQRRILVDSTVTGEVSLWGKRTARVFLYGKTPSSSTSSFPIVALVIHGSQANADGVNIGDNSSYMSGVSRHIVPKPGYDSNGNGYNSQMELWVFRNLTLPFLQFAMVGPNTQGTPGIITEVE